MQKKKNWISTLLIVLLATLVICGLIRVGVYFDTRTIENPRHIIDGGKKMFCETLFVGTTSKYKEFQICLPLGTTSYDDSVVILDGKRTATVKGMFFRDTGITSIQTQAGTFFFPAPSLEEPTPQATFENEPLLVWRTK